MPKPHYMNCAQTRRNNDTRMNEKHAFFLMITFFQWCLSALSSEATQNERQLILSTNKFTKPMLLYTNATRNHKVGSLSD